MFPIIGIVVVFGAVIAGFLMEKGHLLVLIQPSELVTIGGAAIGTLLVANPIHIIKAMMASVLGVFGSSKFSKQRYLDTLRMMFELCNKVRKKGLIGIEDDIEKPSESEVFKKYPEFHKDHHAEAFVCDTLRTAITGGVEPFDMDQMMELDMEVAHHEAMLPVNALTTVADALPGLGIVAAVLGVVITMGSLGGPPEEIGKKVAAALVGTFLGILLCYGRRRTAGRQHDQGGGCTELLPACDPCRHSCIPQGPGPDTGDRDGQARDSRACPSRLRRDGAGMQAARRS